MSVNAYVHFHTGSALTHPVILDDTSGLRWVWVGRGGVLTFMYISYIVGFYITVTVHQHMLLHRSFFETNSCKAYLNAKKLNIFYIHFFAICHLGKPLILQ